jgi:hypothetical protein
MKIYVGIRAVPGYKANVYVDGKLLDLGPSKKDVYDYGADTEWGYFGSGPSQTAAAILYDAIGSAHVAKIYHQAFKREFIANFDQDGFTLLEIQIHSWLKTFQKSEEEDVW